MSLTVSDVVVNKELDGLEPRPLQSELPFLAYLHYKVLDAGRARVHAQYQDRGPPFRVYRFANKELALAL